LGQAIGEARTLRMNIQLLGSPQVHLANGLRPIFKTAKAAGLLYYLAATQRTHSRAALAALLWGEMAEDKARVNLSKALSELREQLGDYITIATQTVTFNKALPYQLDVESFLTVTFTAAGPRQAEQISAGPQTADIHRAADLYRGPFLDGFYIRNALEFEQWQLAERARLHRLCAELLATLAARYRQEGSVPGAISTLRHLLQLEPWREEAHYQLMELLGANGEHHAALRQYELCRAALASELDVEPGEEIARLYTALRINPAASGASEGTAAAQALKAAVVLPHAPVPHNLPYPPTAFIGRAAEIQRLVARLQDPNCRLLTLVGPGGIGKTRLALEVARALIAPHGDRAQERLSEGIFFVDLMPVATAAGIVAAVAEAIGFSFYSDTPPQQQLLGYLRQRKLLLVLDNFEQLADASSLLAELLGAAPGLTLLVTSRIALPLHFAELHALQGLSYPGTQQSGTAGAETNAEADDAVRLFAQSAQRHQPAFAAAQHRDNIVAICRLLQGMPLALELAAAWLRSLPCAAIVRELQKSMALLRAEVGDLEARHRNLQAVLEQTWQRLSPEEARAMARLALFRGGFTLEAAETAAEASPYVLADLVENALIRLDEFERYQIHELLRQFAYAQLAAGPNYEAAATAHAQYFFTLLIDRKQALHDSRQQAAIAAIQAEIDNVRAAWQWAILQPDLPYVVASADTLYDFFRYTCRYSEGKELFAGSAARLHGTPAGLPSQGALEVAKHFDTLAAVFAYHLGEYLEAAQCFHAVLAAAGDGRAVGDVAIAHTFVGFIAGWQGQFPDAERHLQASISHYELTGDHSSLAAVLYGMSDMYAHSGWFQKAVDCAQRCLALGMQLGRNDLLGNAHCELAFALKSLGYPKLALEHYRQGCSCSERSGDRLAYSMNLGGVGIELCQLGKKQWDQGFALIEQSLAICEELGHSVHIATRLYSLQQACIEGKRFIEAMPYAEELMRVATAIGFRRALTYCYLGMAESYLGLGDLMLCRQQLQLALRTCDGMEWNHPVLSHVVTYYALWLERGARQLDAAAANRYRTEAVTLAAAALRWPGWRAYHRKAEELIERQRAHLAVEELAAAKAAAEQGTLEALLARAESSLAPNHPLSDA
jgi:predicted ATPase/DNA-binding SARP family transcriptional activator